MNAVQVVRLNRILTGMKRRCSDPNSPAYKYYGGKGIKVCEEWQSEAGLENFVTWALEHGYDDDLTIDRIDSNKDYEPANCRWLTRSENSRHAHPVKTIRDGKELRSKRFINDGLNCAEMSMRQLADNLGWTPQQLSNRIATGKFTLAEWEAIAQAMGASLSVGWRFPDRTVQA